MRNFHSLACQNVMILAINKPSRVTRKTATTIDHSLAICFIETVFKTAIFKKISYHFPICFLIPSSSTQWENKKSFIKIIFNAESVESFKRKLYETYWKETKASKIPDEAYATLLLSGMRIFFLRKIKLKAKDLKSPWIIRDIKKSSKPKQQLHEQFLKKRTRKNELE